jgi:hypothetical protein
MPANDPLAYGQNIANEAMNLNPITGMMNMAQDKGQALIQMLMQLLQQPQAPGVNPLSGVGPGAAGAMQGGMQGAVPLKQRMTK